MYIEHRGSGCQDIKKDLLCGGAIVHDVWVRDMGPDTVYEECVGWIPPQGGPQADGAATNDGAVRRLGLTPAGGLYGRCRFA